MQAHPETDEGFKFNAIGFVRSGFKEKFAVPRQPGLVTTMESSVELLAPYARRDAFRELSGFSHIWIIFVFHQNLHREWHPTVRPPRLGGNARAGVFASRSPFRPNPIGMSAVELLGIEFSADRATLRVRGADLVDGTPVLDIKPYVPYADSIAARPGFTSRPTAELRVEFSDRALAQLVEAERRVGQPLAQLIREILQLDPRPAYLGEDSAAQAPDRYGVRLFDFDLRFSVRDRIALVEELVPDISR